MEEVDRELVLVRYSVPSSPFPAAPSRLGLWRHLNHLGIGIGFLGFDKFGLDILGLTLSPHPFGRPAPSAHSRLHPLGTHTQPAAVIRPSLLFSFKVGCGFLSFRVTRWCFSHCGLFFSLSKQRRRKLVPNRAPIVLVGRHPVSRTSGSILNQSREQSRFTPQNRGVVATTPCKFLEAVVSCLRYVRGAATAIQSNKSRASTPSAATFALLILSHPAAVSRAIHGWASPDSSRDQYYVHHLGRFDLPRLAPFVRCFSSFSVEVLRIYLYLGAAVWDCSNCVHTLVSQRNIILGRRGESNRRRHYPSEGAGHSVLLLFRALIDHGRMLETLTSMSLKLVGDPCHGMKSAFWLSFLTFGFSLGNRDMGRGPGSI